MRGPFRCGVTSFPDVVRRPARCAVRRVAERGRDYECEADQNARRAGYGESLREALAHLGEFEGGRSGWEHVIAGTHPPIELRLEALE